jgi:hypothetical protein
MAKIRQVKREKHLRRPHMVKTLTGIGKVIKVVVLTALIAFILVACHKNEVISMEDDVSAKVIKSILDHNEIQQYLHPDIENRLPVRVVTNKLIPTNITIHKFDRPVLFLTEIPIEPHLEIVTFKHNRDSIEFLILYDVEEVSISGNASIEGNKVTFTVFDVIEN